MPDTDDLDHRLILLTGATGYVGGRLLQAVQDRGLRVRCLARRPETLGVVTAPTTEVVRGDVLKPETLATALRGVTTAYYLVHSMAARGSFEEQDRRAARNFAHAAHEAGVQRIIYLGGLGSGSSLSPHLASRQEVGAILRESGVPTVELRASIVIGPGSLSFEMIRTLVEKLPVMVVPRWVRQPAQPIDIGDLIQYLLEARELELSHSRVFEIGGADQVSYLDLMREYAAQKGLRRVMITVPVLTPRLSSLWLGLVTPLYARVGRKLIDSVRHATVVTQNETAGLFSVSPRGHRAAIRRAIAGQAMSIPRAGSPRGRKTMSAPQSGNRSVRPLTMDKTGGAAPPGTRLRRFFSGHWSAGDLVRFHTREKLLLLAHDRCAYDHLGRLIAGARRLPREMLAADYQATYCSALEKKPTVGQQVNVLQHILGHFKQELGREERAELMDAIGAYRSGVVPLEIPLGLFREQAIRHQIGYLAQQHYLAPRPGESPAVQ